MYQRLEALRAGKKMPYLCLEKANGGMEMLMRMIGNAGLQAKIFKDIGHPSKDQDLRNRSSIMMIPFRLKTKSISGPVLSSSFWHLLSIFGEPFYPPCSFIPRKNHSVVSSPVEKVLKNDCDMPMFTNDVEESHGLKLTKEYEKNPLNKTCEYTESQYTTVEIAEDGYNHPLPTSDGHYTWKPKFPCRVRVDSFVPVEDKLLLKGLQRYGIGNLEKIQTQYLPTRMLKQISTRIKNLTYRRTPSNPVKDFMTRTSNKLSIIEENMLMEAHKMCEGNWRMIKEKYLPKYPVAILQRLWTELNCEDESTVKNLK